MKPETPADDPADNRVVERLAAEFIEQAVEIGLRSRLPPDVVARAAWIAALELFRRCAGSAGLIEHLRQTADIVEEISKRIGA